MRDTRRVTHAQPRGDPLEWYPFLATSCRSTSSAHPYLADEAPRETVRAEALFHEAGDLIEYDSDSAVTLLREALAADIFHGPAHNNLGVIFLERGELYEAAHEFEWARKLMPGHPDPRINLALSWGRRPVATTTRRRRTSRCSKSNPSTCRRCRGWRC